ncbi:SMP-30/gluconolactonase/LRE family protein [Sphingomonas sp.]|uniref:SMP-30/gluconolactonase/LRE family protein n=1 Tax=Sphingomonas sp. TaxID=28214 RepID=UPI0025E0B7EE|nr:SMP-30/gluconolactonase/LRE family protein [Sphingomonas sp.]
MTAVRCVADISALLGEGPLWDVARETLWWVDIKRARLHRHSPATGETRFLQLDRRITAVGLAAGGRFVACGDEGFVRLDPETGAIEPIATPEGEAPGNRFNDGKVDPLGRFWAGTMDDAEQEASGAIHCLEADGRARRVAEGFRVPNGPAFDSAGRMYLADSALGRIYAYPAGGDAPRTLFASFREEQGFPDGMTCDAEDHLWVAFWDGWCVRRLSPDGRIVAEVQMPVERPTSLAFGGEGLGTLFVTSASVGLNETALAAQPLAGGLFAFEPGMVGRPASVYGRTRG